MAKINFGGVIEEVKDEKKSLFDGAKKFARGFIKITLC